MRIFLLFLLSFSFASAIEKDKPLSDVIQSIYEQDTLDLDGWIKKIERDVEHSDLSPFYKMFLSNPLYPSFLNEAYTCSEKKFEEIIQKLKAFCLRYPDNSTAQDILTEIHQGCSFVSKERFDLFFLVFLGIYDFQDEEDQMKINQIVSQNIVKMENVPFHDPELEDALVEYFSSQLIEQLKEALKDANEPYLKEKMYPLLCELESFEEVMLMGEFFNDISVFVKVEDCLYTDSDEDGDDDAFLTPFEEELSFFGEAFEELIEELFSILQRLSSDMLQDE